MPIRIKSAALIAEKWTRVTPARVEDYRIGIEDPAVDWATPTAAAEGSYEGALAAAARDKRFGRGVLAVGTQHWRERALTVGPARYREGIAASGDAYETGFSPYRETIAGTDLPPRGPTGDPGNFARVQVVGTALRARKLAIAGARAAAARRR